MNKFPAWTRDALNAEGRVASPWLLSASDCGAAQVLSPASPGFFQVFRIPVVVAKFRCHFGLQSSSQLAESTHTAWPACDWAVPDTSREVPFRAARAAVLHPDLSQGFLCVLLACFMTPEISVSSSVFRSAPPKMFHGFSSVLNTKLLDGFWRGQAQMS